MRTEIYYFSGTGNSFHVAKELQKRISGTTLIPIVSLLNKDVIETHGATVGVVFPIHLTTAPIPVKNFMKKLDVQSATYLFAIATRIGTTQRAFLDIDNILKKKGKRLNSSVPGIFTLKSPNMSSAPNRIASVLSRSMFCPLDNFFLQLLCQIHEIVAIPGNSND